ncbi:MAG: amidohydrolase family protein [Betaproteobacteria bacterium]|nr:amidohydrolase family protein [Betaproteobacteria bacterium]
MHDDAPSTYRGSYPRTTLALQDWLARSPREQALESGLPIVDAHHHLYGGATDANFYRKEDLQRDVGGGHRIIGTVYVEGYGAGWRQTGPEALRPVGEVERIINIAGTPMESPEGSCQVAAGIVAHADLTQGDAVEEVLHAHLAAAKGRLRGIRHHTAHADGLVGRFIKVPPKPHLMADPSFRKGFARLGPSGLGYDAWIYHHQLGELIDLADAFPDTAIVLDHVGGVIGVGEPTSRRAAVRARWAQDLRDLAARDNVRVKLGGMGMPVFGFGFEDRERPAGSAELAQAWQPLIDVCIDAFGTRRCMFESNFPVDQQSCGYIELWNAFKLASRALSPDERSDLFYRTACRIYRLPALQQIGDRATAA